MLKFVTDAEESYFEWVNAGGIKRSQVIDEIFAKYPVLSKVTNQEELIAWLDSVIDESLKIMRDIFEKQNILNENINVVFSDPDTDSVTYATSGYINAK
jgi:3-methyladenine DNA glycosylase/8-oxoguanine DNA glycosylase